MGVTLLIGAAPYQLDDRAATWLVETTRQFCAEEDLSDPFVAAPLALAAEIEQRLSRGDAEPIELGSTAVEGLLDHVLRDFLVAGHTEMTAFFFALRRYRGDPVEPI
jgi:hypothetical protein